MGAQGYQESQLNQNAKSPVGAIGVMQLMPATGKDMKVGDITQTEANIHAGIKYMRWMIDQYYEKEPMTQAGQGAVRLRLVQRRRGPDLAMRKEAAKRGLDPNVWFQNVEYVVAEKIGQETVTYVNNIYKYYIGYRLMQGKRGCGEGSRRKGQRRYQVGVRRPASCGCLVGAAALRCAALRCAEPRIRHPRTGIGCGTRQD